MEVKKKTYCTDADSLMRLLGNLAEQVNELQKSDFDERINDLEKIEAESRLICLEQKMRVKPIEAYIDSRLKDIEESIKELERVSNVHGEIIRKDKLAPFKCPACEGAAFHNIRQNPLIQIALKCMRECSICSSHAKHCPHCTEIADAIKEMEKCKSCKGEGIVWG